MGQVQGGGLQNSSSCAPEIIFPQTPGPVLLVGQLYPALPRHMRDHHELDAFLIDPEHKLLLLGLEAEMRDLSFVANARLQQGRLSRGEIRHIIDAELPHANWGGVATTYAVYRPEIRGLLLTLMMLKAQGREIPSLFQQFQSWLRDDGYDEHGEYSNHSTKATDTDTPKPATRLRKHNAVRLWQRALEIVSSLPEENLDGKAAILDLQNGYDLLGRLGFLPAESAVAQLQEHLPANFLDRLEDYQLDRQDENQLANRHGERLG